MTDICSGMTSPTSTPAGAVELLPCPFCGGRGEQPHPDRPHGGMVQCVSCGAEAFGPKWNTRLAAQPASGGVGERYGPSWARWAAPGDNQEDKWLLRFADPDCREAVFNGPDAEREAWQAWNRYAPGFNCWLFRLAALTPAAPSADVAMLRETLEHIASLSDDAFPGCAQRIARATLAALAATTPAQDDVA